MGVVQCYWLYAKEERKVLSARVNAIKVLFCKLVNAIKSYCCLNLLSVALILGGPSMRVQEQRSYDGELVKPTLRRWPDQ